MQLDDAEQTSWKELSWGSGSSFEHQEDGCLYAWAHHFCLLYLSQKQSLVLCLHFLCDLFPKILESIRPSLASATSLCSSVRARWRSQSNQTDKSSTLCLLGKPANGRARPSPARRSALIFRNANSSPVPSPSPPQTFYNPLNFLRWKHTASAASKPFYLITACSQHC